MWRRSGALAAGLVIFALICAASLNKPLASDEAEFGAAARGIVLRGQPLYYVGDVPEPYVDPHDAWITRSTPLPGYQYGLWHSSYYLYCIALSYRCFGFHDFAVRLVGVVCALLTFALLVRFLRAHTQGDWKGSLPWLALLYLTNPYITQMSMMVDFDNTVMTFASVLFLHEYVRLRGRAGVASFLWLAWLVAFSAWSKEYAPVYLGASLLAFHALQRQGKELLRAAAIVLLGLFLFAASWWAFCRLQGLPPDYFLRFSFERRLATGTGSWREHWNAGGLPQLLWAWSISAALSLSWNSIPWAVLVLCLLLERLRFWRRNGQLQDCDLILLYCLAVLAATKLVRPSMASLKYEYPAYPLLILLLSSMLGRRLQGPGWRLAGGIAAGAWALYQLAPDPVLRLLIRAQPLAALGPLLGVWLALLGLLAGVAWWQGRRGGDALLAGLAATTLASHLALDWAQSRAYLTPANWVSDYATRGLEQVAPALLAAGVEGSYPALPKDVGYHLSVKLGNPDFRWLNLPTLQLSLAQPGGPDLFRPELRHVVVRRREVDEQLGQSLSRRGFRLFTEVGDFLVLKR